MFTIMTAITALFACPDECRNLPNGINCDEQGYCWVQAPDWDVGAQWHDAVDTQAGVDADILTPTQWNGVDCWLYGMEGDEAHVCKLVTTCYDLVAYPLEELYEPNFACLFSPTGDWDYTVATATRCYGVFEAEGLAVPLQNQF